MVCWRRWKANSASLSAHVLICDCIGSAKDQADVLNAIRVPTQPAPTVLFLSVLHPLTGGVTQWKNQDEFASGVVDLDHSQPRPQELAVPAGVET